MANPGCHGTRKRRRLLLVQLCNADADPYFRLFSGQYDGIDDAGRLRDGRREFDERTPLRSLYARQGRSNGTRHDLHHSITDFFLGAASLVRRVIDGLLYSLPVRRVESGTGLHHPGCCVQVAFNLGNAIGAYCGGKVLHWGYQYPALIGVPFALVGFILLTRYYKKYESQYHS